MAGDALVESRRCFQAGESPRQRPIRWCQV